MIRSIVTILGQPQIYLLIIKGQMMGNFLENLGLGDGGLEFGTNYLRT